MKKGTYTTGQFPSRAMDENASSIFCHCGFEFCTVHSKPDGSKKLIVHEKISRKVADNEEGLDMLTCPNCGAKMPTDLRFWKRS
jgi:hypothetical protein